MYFKILIANSFFVILDTRVIWHINVFLTTHAVLYIFFCARNSVFLLFTIHCARSSFCTIEDLIFGSSKVRVCSILYNCVCDCEGLCIGVPTYCVVRRRLKVSDANRASGAVDLRCDGD